MTVRGLKDIEQGEVALATRFTQFKLKVEGRRKITAIYSYFILLGVKVMEPGPSQSSQQRELQVTLGTADNAAQQKQH